LGRGLASSHGGAVAQCAAARWDAGLCRSWGRRQRSRSWPWSCGSRQGRAGCVMRIAAGSCCGGTGRWCGATGCCSCCSDTCWRSVALGQVPRKSNWASRSQTGRDRLGWVRLTPAVQLLPPSPCTRTMRERERRMRAGSSGGSGASIVALASRASSSSTPTRVRGSCMALRALRLLRRFQTTRCSTMSSRGWWAGRWQGWAVPARLRLMTSSSGSLASLLFRLRRRWPGAARLLRFCRHLCPLPSLLLLHLRLLHLTLLLLLLHPPVVRARPLRGPV